MLQNKNIDLSQIFMFITNVADNDRDCTYILHNYIIYIHQLVKIVTH